MRYGVLKRRIFLSILVLVIAYFLNDIAYSVYPPYDQQTYSERQGHTRDYLEDVMHAPSIIFVLDRISFIFDDSDRVIALFTILIGLFATFLYFATRRLADIADSQENSTKVIQRAYLLMHQGPDGQVARLSLMNGTLSR